jgi:glycerophosphoryl diester phosphodiesterase
LSATPQVIGHRGWPARFPDNTLAGFLAASIVADAVELDVRRCSDGKLVLSHDPELGGLVVAEHPWSELAEVDLGDGHHPALLDELLAALPDLPIQFEIKNLPFQPGFEPDHRVALEAAERARPGDIVTSFYWPSLGAVRSAFAEVATGVLVGHSGDLGSAIESALQGGHAAVLPHVGLPREEMARALEKGIEVIPWVVDEASLARELAGFGVSGIITDDPALIRSALGGNQ